MTYGNVKFLVSALLAGDYTLTSVKEEQLMLLSYAFNKLATEADALKLFTTNKGENILREGKGNMFVRMPELPEDDIDELDIDDELGYPAARFIASFISKESGGVHEREAYKLIRDYNSKVDSYLTSLEEDRYQSSLGTTDDK